VSLQHEIDSDPVKPEDLEDGGSGSAGADKKYSGRVITMVGYDDCKHCINLESFVNDELKKTSDVPVTYQKIRANTPEGKQIVKEKKLKAVPYTTECLIPTDTTKEPECSSKVGFRKSNYKIKVN
jgi:hypothetical protein